MDIYTYKNLNMLSLVISLLVAGLVSYSYAPALVYAQLNENCTISVLNRTANIRPDGSWRIDNVPASAGLVRARATCVEDGVTQRGQSALFNIDRDLATGFNAEIPLGTVTPIPETVTLSAPTLTLTSAGETSQLTVTAHFSDGSTADVTMGSNGTNYTISNSGVATISADGLVTAVASGMVIISAINEGALGLIQIFVSFSGQDSDGDGIPDDIELANGLDPNDPLDGLEDTDNDGLTNKEELIDFGTDFQVADTDGDGMFPTRQSFNVGFDTSALAGADLNGDGVLDLVATNADPNDVSVLVGNGDGTFQAERRFAVGDCPNSVAVADLDGNSLPDLITANFCSNDVSLLLSSGGGTFQAEQRLVAGDSPSAVAAVDVNGDSLADLLVANIGSDDVSVLLGNGDGTFQAEQRFPAGTAPISIAVADLNGDSFPDLVTANNAADDVSVLLGNGDGTFQAAQPFAAGFRPRAVGVADVDSDNRLDLITANEFSDNVSVLLGNGNGTFQPAASFPVGFSPLSVVVADLNQDGVLDLATANRLSEDVSVLVGNGDGTFQAELRFGSSIDPRSVAVADLNGDNLADLAVASSSANEVSLLFNRGQGDADGDGLSDNAEAQVGTDPNNPDTDGDGLLDGFEVTHSFDPLDGSDGAGDADGDGLTNIEEQSLGTVPNNPDTDSDGLPDGEEVNVFGTDPLVADANSRMYGGVGRGSALNPGGLLIVHQGTGVGILVDDPVTPGGLTGIAFDSSGALFGSTIFGSGTTSTLVRVDPETGALLETVGDITDGVGGPAMSIGDLTFQPGTDVLYGIRSGADSTGNGGKLYTINTATGVATFIGDTGSGAGGGLAFAPNGTLYQAAFNFDVGLAALNTLEPTDGSRIDLVAVGVVFDGLGVRPKDGTVFATVRWR